MKHNKLTPKIAKILRKYFDITFIDSIYIAKAFIHNFNDTEKLLSASEEDAMIAMLYLALTCDKSKVHPIMGTAITVKCIGIVKVFGGLAGKYQLRNPKTGKVVNTIK